MALLSVVEATHNITTKNLNTYQADYFPTSVKSWKKPYKKPVLLNHNSYSGTPVGRIQKAEHTDSVIKKNLQTQRLIIKTTDELVASRILDSTYTTLSIGGSADSAICSICGADILDTGWCGHLKGRKYDGKVCTWLIGVMEYEEISWVNVPADPYAQVIIPDLEAAANGNDESAAFARQLLKEYLEDEPGRRTEFVSKTAAELAKEINDQINSLNTPPADTDSGNVGGTEGSSQQENSNNENRVQNIATFTTTVESLTTELGGIKGEVTDEVISKAIGVVELVVKAISGQIKPEEFMATFTAPANKESLEQVEQRAVTAETALIAADATIVELKDKLNKAEQQTEPLKHQAEQSNKLAQQVAKLARMVAIDRVVDLTIVVEGKSPNDRNTIAESLASKQISDLVADGQSLAEKLPIPQRQQGTAHKDGAGEEEEIETPGGGKNEAISTEAIASSMVAMFSGKNLKS